MQQTTQLLTNMAQFLKGQEEAKKHSAMEKKKTEKPEKPAESANPKEKKFREAMAQVDALEAEGKYKEAWSKVPQPSEYPERVDALRERRASLSKQFAPDLFGAAQPATVTDVEPNTQDDADSEPTAEEVPDEG